jgi:hypothetical protein
MYRTLSLRPRQAYTQAHTPQPHGAAAAHLRGARHVQRCQALLATPLALQQQREGTVGQGPPGQGPEPLQLGCHTLPLLQLLRLRRQEQGCCCSCHPGRSWPQMRPPGLPAVAVLVKMPTLHGQSRLAGRLRQGPPPPPQAQTQARAWPPALIAAAAAARGRATGYLGMLPAEEGMRPVCGV